VSAFIRIIIGTILSINYANKELSLCIEEVLNGKTKVKKKIDFCLDPNVSITNIFNQPIKLVILKANQKTEIGYTQDKSKKTALYIKLIN